MDELIPLDLLEKGRDADIAEVCGQPDLVGRLAELGLRTGCRVRVLQSGSPCLVLVGDARLSLRGDWTMQILVRPHA